VSDGVEGHMEAEVGTVSRATAWRRESSHAWVFVVFSMPPLDRVVADRPKLRPDHEGHVAPSRRMRRVKAKSL